MNRKMLATAICAVLASPLVAFAQDTTATQEQKETTELDTVVVTGSLIPQVKMENANPVVTISSEDIARQGFKNVYDVLRAQPLATGAVQDNQFTNGFTPGATTISLLGLSPGFTLILLDGRPLPDCLRYGNAAAAVVVSRVSCSDAMPYPHEVEALLARG